MAALRDDQRLDAGLFGALEQAPADGARRSLATGEVRVVLRQSKIDSAAVSGDRKSAPWKVAIAAHLKQTTQASNRWLCEHLPMGAPVSVSQLVGTLRRTGGPAARILAALNETLKT